MFGGAWRKTMLTVEDILGSLTARGQWIDNGPGGHTDMRGVIAKLESAIAELDGEVIPRYARRQSQATAAGTATRSRKRTSGLVEISNYAVSGMPRFEWAALRWAISEEADAYEQLHGTLLKLARRSYGRDPFWPRTVRRKWRLGERIPAGDYVPDLVTLTLLELRWPNTYSTHTQRADWFGLSPSHWRIKIDEPYATLQSQAFLWFGGGCTHIANRIGDPQTA